MMKNAYAGGALRDLLLSLHAIALQAQHAREAACPACDLLSSLRLSFLVLTEGVHDFADSF
jgi:hypothetical protein